ncbi:RhoGAP-domain-containing protein [Clavulina sp. PMI_390]|nr:RhoGAP-domain-containing protein [Clavulina sp. PMI_390]
MNDESGANHNTQYSSEPPSGLNSGTYAYDSSSHSTYDDQQYASDAQIAAGGSPAEHDRDHQSSMHHENSSSVGDAPSSDFTLIPRDTGGYDEYPNVDGAHTVVPDDHEPLPDADNYVEDVVQPGFDEAILRALCDMDVGVPLLLDRIKQSMTSCREASVFLKKRATLEEEFGKGLQKLARQTSEVYTISDGKAGTFVGAWHSAMKLHEVIADNRIKFAARLSEMSDELNMLIKEVEKNRKGTKDLATRYEKTLQESEQALEKIKSRHDATADELQRFLLSKEGESSREAGMPSSTNSKANKRVIGKAMTRGGMLLKGKNPANVQRQEEDIRGRMSSAAETLRKAVQETQTLRQEYFNFQLPRILRALKECADEIDLGLQYHLSRYAFLLENVALQDGSTITPAGIEDGPGIKAIVASIDNPQDFKVFMQHYAVSHAPKGPRREGPWEEGFVRYSLAPAPSSPARNSSDNSQSLTASRNSESRPSKGRGPTFGIYLAEQMQRDGAEVPRVVEKCCQAIHDLGALDSVGIYRISGIQSKITKLKGAFDRDVESVDLTSSEWASDINTITSTLKAWFRELPEPLLTYGLYAGFVEAAKIEGDRLRHIRLHERVNDLPDPNYATLKYLMGHLYEVSQRSNVNQMHASNLAIVFGPTLLSPPAPSRTTSAAGEGGGTLDLNWQCKAIETILDHYRDIFVDEEEG